MLRSKLHCQRGFDSIHFSYKIVPLVALVSSYYYLVHIEVPRLVCARVQSTASSYACVCSADGECVSFTGVPRS